MALILCIETATRLCSVALCRDGVPLSFMETSVENSHAALLTSYIRQLLEAAALPLSALDAIAVSMGPGSYTGLRIGVSTAKGLCVALDKPLISVNTLESMAHSMLAQVPRAAEEEMLLVPMIDARRMEVYTAVYDCQMNELLAPCAEIITTNSFDAFTNRGILAIAGDGSEKTQLILYDRERFRFYDLCIPSSIYMAGMAHDKFMRNQFEDLAAFEPFYLKDFVAGKPKVKGLR